MICFAILSLFILIPEGITEKNNPHYGKYFMTINSMTKCNSSEPIHKSEFNNFNFVVGNKHDNRQNISGIIGAFEDYRIIKASYNVTVLKNGEYMPLIGKIVDSPCKDIFLRKLIKRSFNTGDDCIVKKGNQTRVISDSNAVSHKMLGNNFFYNKILTKIEFFSAKGSNFCLLIETESKPLSFYNKH